MPRTINFEGRAITVPDDFTDAEVAQALAGSPAAAPAAPMAPGLQRNPDGSPASVGPAAPPPQGPQYGPPGPQAPSAMRSLKLGTQAVGQGMAELAGAPVDLTTALANAPIAVANKFGAGISPIQNPVMGSESISNAASGAAQALGYEPAVPDTLKEKALYDTARFGTNALGTIASIFAAPARIPSMVAGMRAATPAAPVSIAEAMQAPYATNSGRTLAGDVGAAAGAGGATALTHEYVPDWVMKSQAGPLIDLATTMLGGVGGATATHAGAAMGQKALNTAERMTGTNLETDLGVNNPKTGAAHTKTDVDAAASVMQGQAVNPRTAASRIAEVFNDLAPYESKSSMPTSGAMSDDVGLAAFEKGQRPANPVPFLERDQRVNRAAVDRVEKIAPQDADPNAFEARISDVADARRAEGDQNVARAERGVDRLQRVRTAQGDEIGAYRGQGPDASQALDREIVGNALQPMDEARRRRYDAVPDTPISSQPLRTAVHEVRDQAASLPPNARATVTPEQRVQDFLDLSQQTRSPETGTFGPRQDVTFQQVNRLRPHISSDISDARRVNAPPERIDNLRRLQDAVTEITESNPHAAEANRFYHEDYAPVFGREGGEAYSFRQDVNKDRAFRTASPPSQTAGRFLQAEQPEKTAALQRIFDSMPDPAQGQAAARQHLMSDLAESGALDRTGVIRPDRLRNWATKNENTLATVPGMRDDVGELLARAQKGERLGGRFADELRTATQQRQLTENQINRGALGNVIGADPTHAVASIFKSKNPSAAVDELLGTLGPWDTQARDGLKASVREYLQEKATTSALGKTGDGRNPVSFAKLDEIFKQHEDVLAKVLSPDEMNSLRAAHRFLAPLKNLEVNATAGSNSVDKSMLGTLSEAALKVHFGMLRGGGYSRIFKQVQAAFPSNKDAVADLVNQAWFDPQLAQHLLTRDVGVLNSPAWSKKLIQLMGYEEGARQLNRNAEEQR